MRKTTALLVLLALAVSLYAQSSDITEPVLTSSVSSVVTKTGTVRAIGGSLEYVEMNLSAPQKTNWQLPTYGAGTVKDSEGNTLFLIKEDNPPNPFKYSVSSEVLTKARITDSLPSSYSIPPQLSQYLLPSKGIESDDKAIAELARRITENSTSDFEKVARLAIWVHRNVEYDESLTGREESARWVLSNRRGVCAEFATLFIALARAAGVPARYVIGYSYTGSKGWLGHGWAEVYIGEWVPVDPTWIEAGHLDATHIQTSASASATQQNFVSVYMAPGAKLDWTGSGSPGSKISEVQVKDFQKTSPSDNYAFTAGASTIGFGEETVAYAKLASNDYRVVDLHLFVCSGESAPEVEDPEQFAILEPGEEKIVVWKVTAPSDLRSGYIYTCQMAVGSNYLSDKKISVKMQEEGHKVSFDAQAEKSSLLLGESQTISFSSSKHPAGAKIMVVAEDKVYAFLASSGPQQVSFTPDSLGEKTAWVFSNFGGVEKLTYGVVSSRSLSFGKLSLPERIVEGGSMNLSIPVFSNNTSPKRVKLRASYGGAERSAYAAFSGKFLFNFTFSDLRPGTSTLSVKAEGQGESIESRIQIEVMPNPAVTIQTSFSNGGDLTNVTFTPSKTGDPKSIRVYIDGEVAPLSGGSGTVGIAPGTHAMRVVWYDAYGEEFHLEQELYVPKKGTIFEIPETGGLPCPCPSLLVIPLLFALAVYRKH